MTRQRLQSARLNVFGTPELLKQIMLYLPPLDIVIVQRVCKCFLATIAQSPRIREWLFLRPAHHDAPPVKLTWEEEGAVHPRTNTILAEDDDWMFEALAITSTTAEQNPQAVLSTALAHPSLTPLCFGKKSTDTDEPLFFHYANLDLLRLLDEDPSSSQRSMFLTQPPVTSISIDFTWRAERNPSVQGYARRRITNANGITFGIVGDSSRQVAGWKHRLWGGKHELRIQAGKSPVEWKQYLENLPEAVEVYVQDPGPHRDWHDIFEMTLKFQDVYLKAVEGAHMWDRKFHDWGSDALEDESLRWTERLPRRVRPL